MWQSSIQATSDFSFLVLVMIPLALVMTVLTRRRWKTIRNHVVLTAIIQVLAVYSLILFVQFFSAALEGASDGNSRVGFPILCCDYSPWWLGAKVNAWALWVDVAIFGLAIVCYPVWRTVKVGKTE